MDFFGQQERARRMTGRLLVLFCLAIVALLLLLNMVLTVLWLLLFAGNAHQTILSLPPYFYQTNTAVILGVILFGSFQQWRDLREGGAAVAAMMNGRLVPANSGSPEERRLLNIAEEMALASGIAAPRVYILDREKGINAFAAGYGPNEAIVAVSHGALHLLNRDELQGVVAHEFSHILNGDIRLNMRLIAVLAGILSVNQLSNKLIDLAIGADIDSHSTRSRRTDIRSMPVYLLGMLLRGWGAVGVLCARIIKSSVSRQREYLADASAVQFTRNPDGIGGALRKIGGHGSHIASPYGETLSHLFLGAPGSSFAAGWLASHPPLAERVRRIYGRTRPWISVDALSTEEKSDAQPEAGDALAPLPFMAVSIAEAAAVHQQLALASGLQAAAGTRESQHAPSPLIVPDRSSQLRAAARDPVSAQALVLAMLLASDPASRPAQRSAAGPAWGMLLDQAESLRAVLDDPAAGPRLPWLDLAMPALKSGTQGERTALIEAAAQMVRADKHVSMSEFVLETILSRSLGPHAGRAVAMHRLQAYALRPPLQILVSLLGHAASEDAGGDAGPMPKKVFDRGSDGLIQAGLLDRKAALLGRDELNFSAVRLSLDTLNGLPPLRKALLIKAMKAALSGAGSSSITASEILHLACTALDVPTLVLRQSY